MCEGSAGSAQPWGVGGSWRRGAGIGGPQSRPSPPLTPWRDSREQPWPCTGQAFSPVTINPPSGAGWCGSEGHTWPWEREAQGLWLGGPVTWLLGSFHLLILPPSCCPLRAWGASILSRGWGLLPGSPGGSGTQPRAATVSLTLTGPCEQNRAGSRGSVHTAGLGFESWLCHLATV